MTTLTTNEKRSEAVQSVSKPARYERNLTFMRIGPSLKALNLKLGTKENVMLT